MDFEFSSFLIGFMTGIAAALCFEIYFELQLQRQRKRADKVRIIPDQWSSMDEETRRQIMDEYQIPECMRRRQAE